MRAGAAILSAVVVLLAVSYYYAGQRSTGVTLAVAGDTTEAAVYERFAIDAVRVARVERQGHLEAEQVELQVEWVPVNPADAAIILTLGKWWCAARDNNPCPVGVEAAGVVLRVGPGVTRVAPGDRVMAHAPGLMRRHVVLHQRQLVKIPDSFSSRDAATMPVAVQTSALALLDVCPLGDGDTVLVVGGGSSTGQVALSLARHYAGPDATVIAVCSARSAAVCRDRGASHLIDYTNETIAQGLERLGIRKLSVVSECFHNAGLVSSVAPLGNPCIASTDSVKLSDLFASLKELLQSMLGKLFGSNRFHQVMLGFDKGNMDRLAQLMRDDIVKPTSPIIEFPFTNAGVQSALRHVSQYKHGKAVVKLA